MRNLDELIHDLARNRQIEAEYRAEVEALEEELAQTPQARRLQEIRSRYLPTAAEDVSIAEEAVRKAALERFDRTGDRKVHAEVQIKEYTRLEYDEAAALDYARQHLVQAVKLDRSTFEKVARAAPMDFVTVRKEPKAFITRDLSRWLDWQAPEPDQAPASETVASAPVAESAPL